MPGVVTCPNPACTRRLALPEDLPPGRPIRCPHCQTRVPTAQSGDRGTVASVAGDTSRPAAGGAEEVNRVGRFEVRGRLGAGAFGGVFLAYDPQLDREVALKVPHPGSLEGAARVERFLREARAAANLRHPHIVPLYESGRDGDRYFIAYAYIPGATLADSIGDGGFSVAAACRVVQALAEALAYAHGQGVVHRDVKPTNVMVDGKGQPLLMDFGLASRKDGQSKLTNEGAVLGTPSYMAPEQASGKSGEAGPAADQYSLGCVLFELLTGETPFSGAPEVQVFHHVRTEPPSPRKLRPSVPEDLAGVCLKCLEKDPARRYPDCGALAEDLRRFLAGEPTVARPLGPVARGVRWARRNPVTAGLTVGLVVALAAGVLASSLFAWRAVRGEEDAREQTRVAEELKEKAVREAEESRRREYLTAMQLAQAAYEQHNVARVRELLDAQKPGPGQDDLRGFEWRYWKGRLKDGHVILGSGDDPAAAVSFSPDGKRVAAAVGDKVRVWDVPSGKEVFTLPAAPGLATVCHSPDGKQFVAAGENGFLRVWNAATGAPVRTLDTKSRRVGCVSFSSDGRTMVTGGMDVGTNIWDAADGHVVAGLQGGWYGCSFLSPDGRRLVTIDGPGLARLRDATTGNEIATLRSEPAVVLNARFSPTRPHVASAEADGKVRFWDANSGKELFGLKGPGTTLAQVGFSHDGKKVAAAGRDGLVWVWPAEAGGTPVFLQGHAGAVNEACFSPDGRMIASAGLDGTVRLWDLAAERGPRVLKGTVSAMTEVYFSPDGRQAAGVTVDGALHVWDVETSKLTFTKQTPAYQALEASFSGDGRHIAASGSDGVVRIWDVSAGRETAILKVAADKLLGVCYHPSADRLATGGEDGIVRVWDAATGKETFRFKASAGTNGKIHRMHYSPDGGQLAASVDAEKAGRVWDPATGKEIITLQLGVNDFVEPVFSPNEQLIATAGHVVEQRSLVVIWDRATGKEIRTLRLPDPSWCLSFSSDSKRIATGGSDGMVRIWDVTSGQECLTLRSDGGGVNNLCFSPDGRRLAAGCSTGEVRVWEASGEEQ